MFATALVLASSIIAWPVSASETGESDRPKTGEIVSFGGATMGTSYSVKVFAPPTDAMDLPLLVDAELRQVNSEMSTYLESSEISEFNRSASTDWFAVSPGFASVVFRAIQISEATEGAFDVTIGPLIDAWNFGAAERTGSVPTAKRLESLKDQIGFSNLEARSDPPAIKKQISTLQIDLSSIAKGHAVDRVVEQLAEAGCANVFVEIGGEVRVSGDKNGQPWKVGIQKPDESASEILIAYPIGQTAATCAMATSGDYRNFFEVDGNRYSHTIDPKTMRPVEHNLASVTVVADDCMSADAWATALTVMGDRDGPTVAKREALHTLLISRSGGRYSVEATGELVSKALEIDAAEITVPAPSVSVSEASTLAPMFAITAIALGLIIAAMAVGVMFGKHSISGSCGGIGAVEDAEGKVACSLCSNPADACKDLRARMKAQEST